MADSRERQLLHALGTGSREAFDEIYECFAARLLVYCRAVTKDDNEAREIVQDVFVKLWEIRTSVNTQTNIGALLFVIARNRITDSFRRALRHPVYDDYLAYADRVAAETGSGSEIEYAEFLDMVHKAIGKLPTTQQSVIRLCRLEGLSPAEAAKTLNLSERTVYNQLSLGLRDLRRLISRISTILIPFIANIF